MSNVTIRSPYPFNMDEVRKANPELKLSDLEILREWCEKQPHLPKLPDFVLVIFLHSNYYLLEPTKTTVENYFTMRTHLPEFFANRDPIGSKELRRAFKTAATIPLEGETKDGYKMIYCRFLNTDPSEYYFADCVKYFYMVSDLYVLRTGTCKGYVFIADATGLSIGHVGRLNPVALKKLLCFIQEALPVRLKAAHFIHTPPAMDLVMNMIKPFMKKELANLVRLHSSLNSVGDSFPIDLLPNESGGKAGPVAELSAKKVKELEDLRDWFIEEERIHRVNENLRVGKSKTVNDLFGVEGSFKKLEID